MEENRYYMLMFVRTYSEKATSDDDDGSSSARHTIGYHEESEDINGYLLFY
jgi:hypothetical protein